MSGYSTAVLLRERFLDAGRVSGSYEFEMTLEAFCEWGLVDPAGKWLAAVDWVWAERGWRPADRFPWRTKLFASHEDALVRARGDERVAAAFVEETHSMLAEVAQDEAGVVVFPGLHPRLPAARRPLLVDAMQEYASRLASASALGGDRGWFEIAVRQFVGYRDVLQDPETGWWHLGRDWGEQPGTLCPGAWSRGHGWLLRGVVETLRWLPEDHPGRETLRLLFVETLEALLPLQDDEGVWHVLLHRRWSDSEPETSGTSLIAYAIARGVADGHLPADPWVGVAERAIAAVCSRVDSRGVVQGTCCTPGLLFDDGESLYLRQPIAPDDPHGAPCVLYACLGERLLEHVGT
jgi:hypothetical protein